MKCELFSIFVLRMMVEDLEPRKPGPTQNNNRLSSLILSIGHQSREDDPWSQIKTKNPRVEQRQCSFDERSRLCSCNPQFPIKLSDSLLHAADSDAVRVDG